MVDVAELRDYTLENKLAKQMRQEFRNSINKEFAHLPLIYVITPVTINLLEVWM